MARWVVLTLFLTPLLTPVFTTEALADVGTRAGQIHPDFELPRLDGTLGKLSAYRGKKVFLFNFASW